MFIKFIRNPVRNLNFFKGMDDLENDYHSKTNDFTSSCWNKEFSRSQPVFVSRCKIHVHRNCFHTVFQAGDSRGRSMIAGVLGESNLAVFWAEDPWRMRRSHESCRETDPIFWPPLEKSIILHRQTKSGWIHRNKWKKRPENFPLRRHSGPAHIRLANATIVPDVS